MSIYSEISQEVGWHRQTSRPIPSEKAKELFQEINNGSKEAFKKVVTLHRFMDISKLNSDEEAAFNIVECAFAVGKEMFS